MIALLLLTLGAQAQTTDTFGGTASTNTGNFDYKLNTFDVTTSATLDEIEVWVAGRPGFGGGANADITYVVYQQNNNGAWDLIWEAASSVPQTVDWHASPAVGVPLVAGRSYAIGYWAGFEDIEYYFENQLPLEVVGWGARTGGMYAGNGNAFFRPDPINDNISDLGYRQRLTVTLAVDNDGDGWPENVDCDDQDPTIHPGAVETCDGVDEDCDGVADNNVVYEDWWPDADGDGFGETGSTPVTTCDGPPADHAGNDRDCDDTDANVNPQATESCDGLDEDCDGVADNGVVYEDWWPDADGDGYGDTLVDPQSTCDGAPADHVDNGRDCNDVDANVFPGAPELCNEQDDDCDDVVDEDVVFVDWWPDGDGDGFGDIDASPVNDCAPVDGHVQNDADCNDAVAAVNPDATEICDGFDNNCDAMLLDDEIDSDLDGVLDCSDCAPDDPEVFPGAEEVCNGIDNDCDGEIPTAQECNPFSDETLSVAPACGCAATGAPVPPAALLLGLVALARRRD